MEGVLDKPDVLSLHSGDYSKKVWLHDGQWKRLFTVNQVVDAVRSAHDDESKQGESLGQQANQIGEHLLAWFGQIDVVVRKAISQAYIDFKEPDMIQIVLVQSAEAFEQPLTEAASNLQWDLGQKYSQLKIRIDIAPGPIAETRKHANG
jgi:hypothetical protein